VVLLKMRSDYWNSLKKLNAICFGGDNGFF